MDTNEIELNIHLVFYYYICYKWRKINEKPRKIVRTFVGGEVNFVHSSTHSMWLIIPIMDCG